MTEQISFALQEGPWNKGLRYAGRFVPLTLQKLRASFRDHRNSSKQRGIKFKLTFEEWKSVWEASGKLHLRGCRKGCYVMARFGDKGPYAINNVKIIRQEDNHREGGSGVGSERSMVQRLKQSKTMTGRRLSKETKKKIGDAHRGVPKGPFSKAHRLAISKATKGRTPWNKGIHNVR